MGDLLNRGTKDRPRWYCRFVDVDGKRKQRATKATSKAEAGRFLDDVEARIREGKVGCPDVDRAELKKQLAADLDQRVGRSSITVKALTRHFLGEVEGDPGYAAPRIKDLARYRGDARSVFTTHILPAIGWKPAAEVTLLDVEKLRDVIAKRRKPATVVHALTILSKLYNWARRVRLIDCANPAQGVERPRPDKSVDFLDREEGVRLRAKAEELANAPGASLAARVRFPMVAVALHCGLRKGELYGLRWRDVDLKAGRITVARSYKLAPKSGLVRHVPIHDELAFILRRWKEACPTNPEGVVFPVDSDPTDNAKGGAKPKGGASRERAPVELRMGIERDSHNIGELLDAAECHRPADGKPWHMLRHTFASNFMMARGSLFALQRLLGHASPIMTQRYAHLAPDFMMAEVARMSFAAEPGANVADITEARRRASVAD